MMVSGISKRTSDMEGVTKYGQMEAFTKDIGRMTWLMVEAG